MFSHSPLCQRFFENASSLLDKTAVVVDGKKYAYSQLSENVKKAASVLKSMGVGRGDRIILSAYKDIEFIYLYLASQMIGAVNVIVDASTNEARLQYIENATAPVLCLGYASKKYPSRLFSELDIQNAPLLTESDIPSGLNPDDVGEILFTTGTTGNPKGVCLSYRNVYSSASNINSFIRNGRDDVEILGLPICHSFGLGRIRCNLITGATIVILGNFSNVRLFLKSIEEYKATGFGVVPAAWEYIRKISGTRIAKYAGQLRYIEIGSASMRLEQKREMLQMFPNTRICMHYGLTEASRNSFIEFHDDAHLDSIGHPVTEDVDIKVYDEIGNEQPSGTVGEICVKGNMVMHRYLAEADNREAFFGEYFRTGDCGYIGDGGYIYLVGRQKEIINVGGKKVSPMEVEDVICSLGVGDCVCVPMNDANGILGEVVKCYLLKGSTEMSFEDIAEKVKDKLESYKRPVVYEWIDEIPKTASGKKQRVGLT